MSDYVNDFLDPDDHRMDMSCGPDDDDDDGWDDWDDDYDDR